MYSGDQPGDNNNTKHGNKHQTNHDCMEIFDKVKQTKKIYYILYISDRESNNSDKDLQKGDELEFLPGTLYGKDHPWFWRIHITALVSLGKWRSMRKQSGWFFMIFVISNNLYLVCRTVKWL